MIITQKTECFGLLTLWLNSWQGAQPPFSLTITRQAHCGATLLHPLRTTLYRHQETETCSVYTCCPFWRTIFAGEKVNLIWEVEYKYYYPARSQISITYYQPRERFKKLTIEIFFTAMSLFIWISEIKVRYECNKTIEKVLLMFRYIWNTNN